MKPLVLPVLLCLVSAAAGEGFAAGLTLQTVDEATGRPVPARVLVRAADGVCRVPAGTHLLTIGPDVWFVSAGRQRVELPPGRVELRVERGKEYERVRRFIDLPAQGLELTEKLRRWIDTGGRGYVCAENHVHLEATACAAFCAAEALDYGTSLQWWNRPQYGVPDGEGHVREIEFAGIKVPVTIYDVEVEYQWGALYAVGLANPFPFLNDPRMPNLPATRYCREHGALVCYQGGWSAEVLLDALEGLVDVVNVCNNNFHLDRFMPRSRYSNLLKVEGFPVYPDTPEGMLALNLETYYRLLNCGLELAAGAGSAIGVKQTPVGYNRAYVRAQAAEGPAGMLEAWRRGNNFVTNGPMLFLTGPGGSQPGDRLLSGSAPGECEFEIEAASDCPLGPVELVVNGDVAGKIEHPPGARQAKGKVRVNLQASSWVCARATDTDTLLPDAELSRYDDPPGPFTVKGSRLRFAHTSPIYFRVAGRPAVVEKSVLEGLMMIDALEGFAVERSGPEWLEDFLTACGRARQKLKGLVE
ncbi:MAG: CehA/McbA family metallohydrolase [Candidatus Glassbacteria bacterium]